MTMTTDTAPTCIWRGSEQPRAVKHRHLADCAEAECRGCQPCSEDHCLGCGVTHHASVCPGCRHDLRLDLDAIGELAAADRLRAQATSDGLDSEAMNALGPTLGRDEYRIHAGEILDERHPLWVAHSWARLLRDTWGQPEPAGKVTLDIELHYLDAAIERLAEDITIPWTEVAREVADSRRYLEGILRDGEQRDTGAPCLKCERGVFVKRWGNTKASDTWVCSRCDTVATEAEYRLAVAHVHALNADWLNLGAAAMRLGIATAAAKMRASRQRWARQRTIEKVKVYCAACIDAGRRCEQHADNAA